jgi:sugar phosphate permease
MGSVADDQRGAAAGVNNTTRELGGTLGVAVFGSVFASAYAPKIISAFKSLPVPSGPKAEAHQSVAAAIAVVAHAPRAAQPVLQSIAFNAFHSGLEAACIAGAGIAVLGALCAFALLPGRPRSQATMPVVATTNQIEFVRAGAG